MMVLKRKNLLYFLGVYFLAELLIVHTYTVYSIKQLKKNFTFYRQHLRVDTESRPQQHTWNRFDIIQDYFI
jgi:hypothetical protein